MTLISATFTQNFMDQSHCINFRQILWSLSFSLLIPCQDHFPKFRSKSLSILNSFLYCINLAIVEKSQIFIKCKLCLVLRFSTSDKQHICITCHSNNCRPEFICPLIKISAFLNDESKSNAENITTMCCQSWQQWIKESSRFDHIGTLEC